jgi:hypothetical protein
MREEELEVLDESQVVATQHRQALILFAERYVSIEQGKSGASRMGIKFAG